MKVGKYLKARPSISHHRQSVRSLEAAEPDQDHPTVLESMNPLLLGLVSTSSKLEHDLEVDTNHSKLASLLEQKHSA